jgi:catechol 2,3-dioxygenase-like lactoylglutathione lyase family enzyme
MMIRTYLLFALAFLVPDLARSARSTTDAPVIAATGAFFALSVADVNASAEWYAGMLGLTVVMKAPMTSGAAVIVLEGQGLIVELIQHDGAVPLSKAAPTVKDRFFVHGLAKAGVIVTDFDGTIDRLKKRGVEILYGPFPAKENQRANAIVLDNSGNLIQIFWSARHASVK